MKKTSFILAILAIFAFNNACFATTPLSTSIEETQKAESPQDQSLAYSNRASMRFLKKDINGAIADFDKAIELNPKNPELYLNRGYIKQLTNDLKGALADYNNALSINPRFAFAYNNRGVLKVALNDIQGAMDDYAKAIELNGKYSDAFYNRANLKYMLSDNKGALADYDKAIELNPKDSEAYNNRGVVRKRLNFNVGALSDYTQAIALNPKDSIAYANRGRLKKLYFDNEGAAIDLDQAIALAETQSFIKNVKPLLSNESYIAAIPNSNVLTTEPIIAQKIETKPALPKQKEEIQQVAENKPAQSAPVAKQETPKQEKELIATITPAKEASKIEPAVTVKPKEAASTSSVPSSGTISAGVATVQAAVNPVITTKPVTKTPTTNVKLAESYYIRGLQKCVLRDLKGAIADLNKAIENNAKYADAYYYRAAIRKELGDTEGFRKDYSTAIQINPSLQAFNDANCLSLVRG